METRLRSFTYDVETNNVKIVIEDEPARVITDMKDIAVITNAVTEDYAERRERTESANENIKPYGLELVDKGEIETPQKVEPAVINEHIEKAVKKNTRKKSK